MSLASFSVQGVNPAKGLNPHSTCHAAHHVVVGYAYVNPLAGLTYARG